MGTPIDDDTFESWVVEAIDALHFRTPEALRAKVIDTVQHEIAHHFGISDDRLRELARERGAR
jgi:predicted Zn-dependent protease with MMP-like domain